MSETNSTETSENALMRISREKNELQVKLDQAMRVLGYPVPVSTPESDLKCRMCACKERDYQKSQIEQHTLWKAFKLLAECR